jgi:transposase InsO family protein
MVHEILRRDGRIDVPPGGGAVTERFEKEAPNQLWQMDFKGWVTFTDGRRCHPVTVVDYHSRYLSCLRVCADQLSGTVRERLRRHSAVLVCRTRCSWTMACRGAAAGGALDAVWCVVAEARHRGSE